MTTTSNLHFVAVSSLSEAEQRQYWAKGIALFFPRRLPESSWSRELERLGLPLDQGYFVVRAGREGGTLSAGAPIQTQQGEPT